MRNENKAEELGPEEMHMKDEQVPMGSGFGRTTTAQEVTAGVQMQGKTVIVTGGYSGLGLETTRALAQAGASVVVPTRSPDKARSALAGIPGVEQAPLDLLDPASIDAFACRFLQSGRPLHALINSAGIMAPPLHRDASGNESQWSANHLGHFRLTARLWPALRSARGARVVSVSSRGHRIGGIDFDDPNFIRRPYEKWKAYGQAKTANALFAIGLDARGKADDVRAFSLHPGTILTDLLRDLTDEDLLAFGVQRSEVLARTAAGRSVDEGGAFKNAQQGAATSLWCATSEQLAGRGGVYCEDVDIAARVSADHPGAEGVRPWAADPDLAERLWLLSEKTTGVALGSVP